MRLGRRTSQQVGWPEDYLRPPALIGVTGPPVAPSRPRTPLWLEAIETALLTLVLFVLVRTVVLNFKVDGLSMAPTLAHGQYLLINRVAYLSVEQGYLAWWPWPDHCVDARCYLFGPPRRGDIVVFWPPSSSQLPYIKRVIGLPGERVEVRGGKVLIDGAALEEPYINGPVNYSAPPTTVAAGEYYVLGDNRNSSTDSHLFGLLPGDQIIGQAWLSYWPRESWGTLPPPRYQGAEGAREAEGSEGTRATDGG
jgi:signal peptidase I